MIFLLGCMFVILCSFVVFCPGKLQHNSKIKGVKRYRVWPGLSGECPTAPRVKLTSSPGSWDTCRTVSQSVINLHKTHHSNQVWTRSEKPVWTSHRYRSLPLSNSFSGSTINYTIEKEEEEGEEEEGDEHLSFLILPRCCCCWMTATLHRV